MPSLSTHKLYQSIKACQFNRPFFTLICRDFSDDIFCGVLWLHFGGDGDDSFAEGFKWLYLVYVGHVEDEVLDAYGAELLAHLDDSFRGHAVWSEIDGAK